MSLDPIFMKVLLYMCPQNELSDILQHTPPILGISFFIHFYSAKKSMKEDEVFIVILLPNDN